MKKNIGIYVVIILLVCVCIGEGTYIFINKKNKEEIKENVNDNKTNNDKENNEQSKEPIKEDGVKLVKTYNKNDKIIEEFEITLNNKSQTIKVEFGEEIDENYEDPSYHIFGMIESKKVYDNYRDCKNSDFNTLKIENKFNEDNFKIIKGTDNKSYLLITTDNDNLDYDNSSELLVYNDKMKLISKGILSRPDYSDDIYDGFKINEYFGDNPCGFENNINPLYSAAFTHFSLYNKDTNYLANELKQYVKIDNNKIYVLYPKFNNDIELVNGSYGDLEERAYTINSDKLSYEVINKYKITEVCAFG